MCEKQSSWMKNLPDLNQIYQRSFYLEVSKIKIENCIKEQDGQSVLYAGVDGGKAHMCYSCNKQFQNVLAMLNHHHTSEHKKINDIKENSRRQLQEEIASLFGDMSVEEKMCKATRLRMFHPILNIDDFHKTEKMMMNMKIQEGIWIYITCHRLFFFFFFEMVFLPARTIVENRWIWKIIKWFFLVHQI